MNTLKTYILATRPGFLSITLLGCAIGIFANQHYQTANYVLNTIAISVILCIHAFANVLNDYFDHLNGGDLLNHDRVSPYTGGSRFIQDSRINPGKTLLLAFSLLTIAIILGLIVCINSSWNIFVLGILGVLIAWGYSAPPLELMSRGIWGELAISLAWSLIVIGFSTLQTGDFLINTIPIALSYGLIVANILFLNQIPDMKADRTVGKLTLAVKIFPHQLWQWYVGIFLSAYLLQISAILFKAIGIHTLLTFFAMPAFIACAVKLRKAPLSRAVLTHIIPLNILGAHLYAAALIAGLYWDHQHWQSINI